MMIAFTSLPGFVTLGWRGMPNVWRGRHRLLLGWLLGMHAVSPGRKTWEEMARGSPARLTAWRLGRLRKAAEWNVHLSGHWLAQDLLVTLPPPTHGLLSRCGDGRHAAKRGTKHPVAPPGRISQPHPWCFGGRVVRVMAAGDGERVPVCCRLLVPKRHAPSRREHPVFRERVAAVVPPRWAKRVMVGGAAASGSKANRRRVQDRAQAETARRWGCVCAITRTWKTVEEHTLKNLVPHVPRQDDHRPQGPREMARKGRRTFWT